MDGDEEGKRKVMKMKRRRGGGREEGWVNKVM